MKGTHIVTGGSGFLGSHIIDRLMKNGEKVICIDNLDTGIICNVKKWLNKKNFIFINEDVKTVALNNSDISHIWHLACPASPLYYQQNPLNTMDINYLGTKNILEIARQHRAKLLFASSSEIYGTSINFPQNEISAGFVNPNGLRSCYLEGKRIAETLCYEYRRLFNMDIKVVRIFNTYGPKMGLNDKRVISEFILRLMKNQDIIIYGDGNQTRSFCYVDDTLDMIFNVMSGDYYGPINIGNDEEIRIKDLAFLISSKLNKKLIISYEKSRMEDPIRRVPSIKIANDIFDWSPKIKLEKGLDLTIRYFLKIKKV